MGMLKSYVTFRLRVLIRRLSASCKKAKNTIKTKRSSVLFNLFISAIGWLALFSFCWFDCWLGHWWSNVNSLKSCCWLVKIIFIKQANELSKMLNGRCKLLDIFFF